MEASHHARSAILETRAFCCLHTHIDAPFAMAATGSETVLRAASSAVREARARAAEPRAARERIVACSESSFISTRVDSPPKAEGAISGVPRNVRLTQMFSTVMRFCVSVPVLSDAITVAAPKFSIMSDLGMGTGVTHKCERGRMQILSTSDKQQ